MDRIKGGVSGIGSAVTNSASGITSTVKSGANGIGSKMATGASGFTNTFKDGINWTGSHIKDGVENVSDYGYTVKDTLLHGHKQFDHVDELINHYRSDLKISISGFKAMQHKIHHMCSKNWPNFFKINLCIVERLIRLIGQDSLSFKGINEYYDKFTSWQSEQIIPHVHPKDRQFIVQSINKELWDYKNNLEQLQDLILGQLTVFETTLKSKNKLMINHLKNVLKLIKLRAKKKRECDKIQHQISKLMSKTSPLDDKEQVKLTNLEVKLKPVSMMFNRVDDKVKTILPHVICFLEEYIDSITKFVICEQSKVYKEVYHNLKQFSVFNGLLVNPLELPNNGGINTNNQVEKSEHDSQAFVSSSLSSPSLSSPSSSSHVYAKVVEQWHNTLEPIRLQIETDISLISEKNPELVEKELDPNVKDDSMASKLWKKAAHSLERSNPVRPKDSFNGVFGDDQMADPIVSFEKYNNPRLNVSETYHPTERLDIDDIIVPHSLDLTNYSNQETPSTPPQLPPRSNITRPLPALPQHAAPLTLSSPKSTIASGIFSPVQNATSLSLNSIDDIDDSNLDKTDDEDDASSIMSDSSAQTSITMSSSQLKYATDDGITKDLTRLYNSTKNSYTDAPIISSKYEVNLGDHEDRNLFENFTSVSYRLIKFNTFFTKLSRDSDDIQIGTAIYDFKGVEPGDLSFKAGDTIRILYTFPKGSVMEKGWYVGETGELNRTGFVPGNYLSFE